MAAEDWNPASYQRFRSLRLRPALELLAQVRELPEGAVIDMGCGSGAMAEPLAQRYPGRELIGLDSSPAMLAEAESLGFYGRLVEAEAEDWEPDRAPALIFSNALCHWLPDHPRLFASWLGWLGPRGTLAVQMPRQFGEPSHALLREIAADMFPDRFDFTHWRAPVAPPESYADFFASDAPEHDTRVWETIYQQHLPASDVGHPVRAFTQSTAMRPFLANLSPDEAADFTRTYDLALETTYPRREDGSVFFPFRRLFFVVQAPA